MIISRTVILTSLLCSLTTVSYAMQTRHPSTQQTPFSSDIHVYRARKESLVKEQLKPTKNNEPYVAENALMVQEVLRKVVSSPALTTKTK